MSSAHQQLEVREFISRTNNSENGNLKNAQAFDCLMRYQMTVEVGNGKRSLWHDREATAGVEAIGDGL